MFSTKKFSADKGQGSEEVRETDSAADDYLSKLANSILSKDKPRRPHSSAEVPLPGKSNAPRGSEARTSGEVPRSTPSSGEVRRPVAFPSGESKRPSPSANHNGSREWVRHVEVEDENGAYIPGTILLFEDGSVGLYKEFSPAKEYDIIYMLRSSGLVSAQGMPMANYHVEPLGRLSPAVFDSVVRNNQWERDMIVFHLLRYTDRTHIPEIVRHENPPSRPETFSKVEVRRLDETAVEEPRKPNLVRGRQVTIQFGPDQKWNAVYWGKDELGHVVAHNTHDKWALMHLDLDRFKDSMVFHDVISDETMRRMERDFSAA